MMRSMYSGVSGLRVHQARMDVIGNNIANVNTVGYKKGQVTFKEVLSQVIRGAGAPQDGKGGTNPQQIGLGLNVGSMNTIHTTGAAQRTDVPTDLMIDGDGFFIVEDPNGSEFYTRAGNFAFDREGNLVTADGWKVKGEWSAPSGQYDNLKSMLNADTYDGIKISKSLLVPPVKTTEATIVGNLDSDTDASDANNNSIKEILNVYNELGEKKELEITFTKTGADTWAMTAKYDGVDVNNTTNNTTSIDVTFSSGKLATINGVAVTNPTQISFDIDGAIPDNYGIEDIPVDITNLQQYAGINEISGETDGMSSGSFNGYAFDASGKLSCSFTNGVMVDLWQLKLAKFDNPMGLEKLGNNLFGKSSNSGVPKKGNPGVSGLGAINPGVLEMSNVDLSMEFTDMITTQRGFQASSRIITTTDEMLQELVNMKR